VRGARAPAGLGAALCLVAGGFGVTALYLPGAALLLIAGSAVVYVHLATRGASVARSLGSSAVEEQAATAVTVSVSRPGPRISAAEVRAWPDGPAWPLRGSASVAAAVRFPRRGRHRLGPAALVISDPLGLATRVIESDADEVLVLPRIEPVRFAGETGPGAGVGRRPLAGAADPMASEVDGIQQHQPGTPASRIHWPAVARTATLMERRLVIDGDQAPLVVVDPRGPVSPEALDRAVRAAASLCVHLARRGGCALLLPGDRRVLRLDVTLAGFEQVHARLAVLGPEAGSPPLNRAGGARAVLWVTAAAAGPRQLEGLRAPVRYLVSPHAARRSAIEFVVAGCSGQRLGPVAGWWSAAGLGGAAPVAERR
jgi:uncharacterized protein (DUF58 family)